MWSTLAGRLDCEVDEALLDLARHRFHAARDRDAVQYTPLAPQRTRLSCGFVAHREPWRLATISLGDGDGGWLSDVVAWSGRGWATLGGDPLVVRGDTRDPYRDGTAHGDCGLTAMLNPDWLGALIGAPLSDRVEVTPRRMLQLNEREEWWYAASLIAIGIDRQIFTYRQNTEVLTSMTALVDDQVAWSIRLSSVEST